jgi:hypothetical protein
VSKNALCPKTKLRHRIEISSPAPTAPRCPVPTGCWNRPYDLKRRVAYWLAEEPAAVVRDFEKPACPTPRIAADLRVREIADNAQRLVAGGRPVRQIDPFVVTHHALTKAEIEKITRHDLLPLDKEDRPIPSRRRHARTRRGALSARSATLEPH